MERNDGYTGILGTGRILTPECSEATTYPRVHLTLVTWDTWQKWFNGSNLVPMTLSLTWGKDNEKEVVMEKVANE